LKGLLAVAALFLFISSVTMIGTGLKCIAKDEAGEAFLNWIFSLVDNPVSGLFIGVLVTSLVQSSSLTTSMVVGLVAAGDLELVQAIPVIMGANIGTSVTNLLVSMANVPRRLEFRRSLSGAIVHDFFNVLSVLVLLPLEVTAGVISRPTSWVAAQLGDTRMFASDPAKRIDVLKTLFGAIGDFFKWFLGDALGLSPTATGSVIACLALVMLFVSLWMLVKMLRGLMQKRLSGMFDRTIFRNPPVAFAVGIALTAVVQSSSVTTSLIVPLVGAGVLRVEQIYPYTLGANIGTTVTAMLAALGTASAPAVACALGHLLFNIYGTCIFWPLKFVPISLAMGFAKMAARRRLIAVAFLIGFFFLLPITAIVLIRVL
jgi:sodium-dependent phosphate cotransporter